MDKIRLKCFFKFILVSKMPRLHYRDFSKQQNIFSQNDAFCSYRPAQRNCRSQRLKLTLHIQHNQCSDWMSNFELKKAKPESLFPFQPCSVLLHSIFSEMSRSVSAYEHLLQCTEMWCCIMLTWEDRANTDAKVCKQIFGNLHHEWA